MHLSCTNPVSGNPIIVAVLVDRLRRLVAVPQKSKPMTALDLVRKRVDQVEKSYGRTREEFDDHGHNMDIYMLQEPEESVEESKLELRKISRDLLFVEDVGELEDRVTRLETVFAVCKNGHKAFCRKEGRKASTTGKRSNGYVRYTAS